MKRTSFLTASAALVAASTAAAQSQTAQTSVPGGTHLVERKADFDNADFDKLLGRPAEMHQLWECVAFKPGIFNNIKNALNGLQFGFGYAPDQIAMAMANHGPSASYGYSDYVWKKYRIGEFFKLKAADGAPISSNVFLAKHAAIDPSVDPDNEKGMYQDASIEMLQHRGLEMMTCHTAVEEQSRALVKKGFAPSGMTATQVADDILTHLVPGSVVVPSMVAAIAVLQVKFHYAYITVML